MTPLKKQDGRMFIVNEQYQFVLHYCITIFVLQYFIIFSVGELHANARPSVSIIHYKEQCVHWMWRQCTLLPLSKVDISLFTYTPLPFPTLLLLNCVLGR